MVSVVGLSMLLLWVNRNALGIKATVWIYVVIALVCGNAYIIFEFTIREAALRRKLERDGNRQ